jgi:hypothetical protein
MTWVKCGNPNCEAEYEMSLRAYYKALEDRQKESPDILMAPALTCEKCGEQSICKAAKCARCGPVFQLFMEAPFCGLSNHRQWMPAIFQRQSHRLFEPV